MLLPDLEPVVAVFLEPPRDDAGLQEVPDLLAEEYFLLDLHWVGQPFALHYFGAGLEPGAMEHVVVAVECLHHGL